MKNVFKRALALFAAAAVCFICTMPLIYAAAEDEDYEYANPTVVDDAGFLSADEFNDITEMLDALRDKYYFDTVIYTEDTMLGQSAEETADDIFDYGGYGYGDDKDGIILYVSRNPRKYHFSTHAAGTEYFNDAGLIHIEEEVLPYLKNNDYYGAFKAYAETADEMLDMAANGKPYGSDDTLYNLCVIGGAILIPLIIAGAATSIKGRKMNTAVSQNYAKNYEKGKQINLSRDIFLYSTVTKSEKPKETSNDSTTHVSSSGETHGGRGGDY